MPPVIASAMKSTAGGSIRILDAGVHESGEVLLLPALEPLRLALKRFCPACPAAWAHMGATVMIGQNDSAGEEFTTAERAVAGGVRGVDSLARGVDLVAQPRQQCGVTSRWSAPNSNLCSGVAPGAPRAHDILRRRARSTAPSPRRRLLSAPEAATPDAMTRRRARTRSAARPHVPDALKVV